jgi:hypothetical protein
MPRMMLYLILQSRCAVLAVPDGRKIHHFSKIHDNFSFQSCNFGLPSKVHMDATQISKLLRLPIDLFGIDLVASLDLIDSKSVN